MMIVLYHCFVLQECTQAVDSAFASETRLFEATEANPRVAAERVLADRSRPQVAGNRVGTIGINW